MSQPQQAIDPGPSISGHILSPTEYAIFGTKLGAAGFSQQLVSEMMGRMERRAMQLAVGMATTLVTETVSDLAGTIQRVHYNSATEVHRQISNRMGGFGGVTAHRRCAEIAWAVANGTPLHAPIPASPIVGSVR